MDEDTRDLIALFYTLFLQKFKIFIKLAILNFEPNKTKLFIKLLRDLNYIFASEAKIFRNTLYT